MIRLTSGSPMCPTTQRLATLFCCNPDCKQPAFSCSQECLAVHSHQNFRHWSQIDDIISLALELPLEKQQIQILQKQEKDLLIFMQELKTMQLDNYRTIKSLKASLKLKGAAKKLADALRTKSIDRITGSDMSQLIKMIEKDDIFLNKEQVNSAIKNRHSLNEEFIKKLNSSVIKQKQKLGKLNLVEEQTQKINTKFTKIKPKLDLPKWYEGFGKKTGNTNDMVKVKSDYFSMKTEPWPSNFYPVFGQKPLSEGEYFEVQVSDRGDGSVTIGVGTAALKNTKSNYDKIQSMCIQSRHGILFTQGKQHWINCHFDTGDIITVRRSQGQIQWLRNGKKLCSAFIPFSITVPNLEIYPVCWIQALQDDYAIAILRFV